MTEPVLSEVEARILGSLIEKQIATPEYYPLTLNAVVMACNQKSNRDPVVAYSEKTVSAGLDSLRQQKLAWLLHPPGSRTAKYEHRFDEVYGLNQAETAVLCELLLRGPQTLGELRGRASRLCQFNSIQEVEVIVNALSERPEPLVMQLPRQPGRKEPRYRQLLSDELVDAAVELPEPDAGSAVLAPAAATPEEKSEIAELRLEIAELRRELGVIKEQLGIDDPKQNGQPVVVP